MKPSQQASQLLKQNTPEGQSQSKLNDLGVSFPPPTKVAHSSRDWLPCLDELLPRRWRRRVVIQGQQFWLPGVR